MSEKPQVHAPGAAQLWWPGTLFVLLVLVVYADPLFLRRNFAGRDLVGYALPIEKSTHDAYSRLRLPVWLSEVSGGRPLIPNPNTGAFYPVRPLLALIPFPLAMRVFPVLHWALSGVGMIVLLLSMGVSRAAAWVGAVTYAFSGVSVSEVFFPSYQPGMTLLPWILWAFHRAAPRVASNILLLSFLFALDFFAGDVFTSSLAILCCALWLLLEMDGTQVKSGLVVLALSLFLALLLAAPQIVATTLWIPETNRAVLGMKLEDVFTYSIHVFRILELVIPYPFGAVWEGDHAFVWGFPAFFGRAEGFFLSLYAGSFAVVALVPRRRPGRSGARFARALLALTLALSVSPSLLPASWRAASSPLPLRYPEKLAVRIAFALAILAGSAFDGFRRPERRPRWVPVVGLILVALAVLVSLFPVAAGVGAVRLIGSEPWLASRAAQLLPGAVTEAAVLWVVTVIALELLRSRSAMAVLSALALLTLCVLVPNRKIAQTLHEEEIFCPSALVRFLDRADPARTYRVLGESIFHPQSELAALDAGSDHGQMSFPRRSWTQLTGALWSRGTVFNYDYDAGDLARLESLRRTPHIASATTDLASLFGSLALRWGVRYADQAPVPGYGPFAHSGAEVWDENPRALPDIRLVNQWQEAEDPRQALGELLQLAPGQVVLETGRRASGTARPGDLRIFEKSPESLRLETETVDPTWLFVLRGFWNHRTVTIDGREVECIPAQLAFSAVRVPAGRHRIDWREKVPGGRVSRWGSVIFALAAAGLLARERRLARLT